MCWQRLAGRGLPIKSQKDVVLSPLNFVPLTRRPSPTVLVARRAPDEERNFGSDGPKVSRLQSKVGDVISIVMNKNGVLAGATKFRNHVPKGLRKAITRLLVKCQVKVNIEVYWLKARSSRWH